MLNEEWLNVSEGVSDEGNIKLPWQSSDYRSK